MLFLGYLKTCLWYADVRCDRQEKRCVVGSPGRSLKSEALREDPRQLLKVCLALDQCKCCRCWLRKAAKAEGGRPPCRRICCTLRWILGHLSKGYLHILFWDGALGWDWRWCWGSNSGCIRRQMTGRQQARGRSHHCEWTFQLVLKLFPLETGRHRS